jgi:4'-phosphopantetheinyl transferase
MTDWQIETNPTAPLLTVWETVPSAPPLPTGALHLWRLDLSPSASPEHDLAILSQEERARLAQRRLLNARNRISHIWAMRRRILGHYLDIAPDQVAFEHGPHGKPQIEGGGDLHFNLSHSSVLSVLAIQRDREIGIDVEQIRPRSGLLTIARRLFTPTIIAQLTQVAAADQLRLFYHHWTHLEAGVKARGGGLFDPNAPDFMGLDFAHFIPAFGFQGCIAACGQLSAITDWRTLALN